ncbi:hypothetical protein TNCV_2442231 [Trichonephila clavipes]|nr:hypothetical protein TNCV_2442231 [Trichonephila clavipes]
MEFCRPLASWSRVIFSDKSRFIFKADNQPIRVWRRPVRSSVCCRDTYGNYTIFYSDKSPLLGHTIPSSRLSTHFDGTQLCGRDFNAIGSAYGVKLAKVPFISKATLVHILCDFLCDVFKDMTYFRDLPSHQTSRQSNTWTCLEAIAAVPEYW